MANPDTLSMNGASTFINFHSLGFNNMCCFGKSGIDLFKKLKQHSHKFIIPCNSNIFLIPKTKSHMHILNLCPCISMNIGIMNNAQMNYPFSTRILCVIDVNFGSKKRDLHC